MPTDEYSQQTEGPSTPSTEVESDFVPSPSDSDDIATATQQVFFEERQRAAAHRPQHSISRTGASIDYEHNVNQFRFARPRSEQSVFSADTRQFRWPEKRYGQVQYDTLSRMQSIQKVETEQSHANMGSYSIMDARMQVNDQSLKESKSPVMLSGRQQSYDPTMANPPPYQWQRYSYQEDFSQRQQQQYHHPAFPPDSRGAAGMYSHPGPATTHEDQNYQGNYPQDSFQSLDQHHYNEPWRPQSTPRSERQPELSRRHETERKVESVGANTSGASLPIHSVRMPHAIGEAGEIAKEWSSTYPSLMGVINLGPNDAGQRHVRDSRPRLTTIAWEEEGTLCIAVETKKYAVARRCDNNMINGTKLLNFVGMTRGRRDGILKGEKARHVIRVGSLSLKGVWIPFERALLIVQREEMTDYLYPLFVADVGPFLLHPNNMTRTLQVIRAAQRKNPSFQRWTEMCEHRLPRPEQQHRIEPEEEQEDYAVAAHNERNTAQWSSERRAPLDSIGRSNEFDTHTSDEQPQHDLSQPLPFQWGSQLAALSQVGLPQTVMPAFSRKNLVRFSQYPEKEYGDLNTKELPPQQFHYFTPQSNLQEQTNVLSPHPQHRGHMSHTSNASHEDTQA